MEITVRRRMFKEEATIGDLYVDSRPVCYSLEDVDRGLTSDMSPEDIAKVKVQNATAIPYGRYEVIIDMSSRFGRMMPHVLDVPGFTGIRIHKGNTDKDTDGCVLVGTTVGGPDFIGGSETAFDEFFPMLEEALKIEKCFINITKDN